MGTVTQTVGMALAKDVFSFCELIFSELVTPGMAPGVWFFFTKSPQQESC